MDAERPRSSEREDGQVDDVAGAADDAELEQLHPVVGLAGAEVDAAQRAPGPVGGSGPRRRPRRRLVTGALSTAAVRPRSLTPSVVEAEVAAGPGRRRRGAPTARALVRSRLEADRAAAGRASRRRAARRGCRRAVGDAAPVDALVARARAETRTSPACGAVERRPEPGERVGVVVASRSGRRASSRGERRRVALEVPAGAAAVARPAIPGRKRSSLPARSTTASTRGRRAVAGAAVTGSPSCSSQANRSTPVELARGGRGHAVVQARRAAAVVAARRSPRRPRARADRELGRAPGRLGVRLQHPPVLAERVGERRAGCSTWVCAWSAIRITAWSSRKASIPPAASTSSREGGVGVRRSTRAVASGPCVCEW